uniref:Uncharacterized protein n=1 Tax=Tanacetum cinerariifolium TaxID=118510 RepID=A0A6L2M9I0_TANCI|nr:hypothetical protein [Tanacetum cinerariifolium]
MAISIILVSSNSSERSVGTSAGRVIMFGTIPTTIPDTTPTMTLPTTHVYTTLTSTEIPTVSPIVSPSLDYIPASPDYSLASDTESDPSEDPSPDHIPPLPTTLPFLSSTDDTSNSNTPDTPPSSTHDLFTSNDSSRDLPSDSSSKTSSDSSLDALSDSSSGHLSLNHSSPALATSMRSSHQLCLSVSSIPHSSAAITERPSHFSSMGPSRKRSRSPTTSVLISAPIPGALSAARADLLPPPKRIRSSDFVTDLEDCSNESSESSISRETSLRDDVVVRSSDKPYLEPGIDLEIQANIDECIA